MLGRRCDASPAVSSHTARTRAGRKIICRSTGTGASSSSRNSQRPFRRARPSDAEALASQLQEIQKLAQEALDITLSSGPRGIRRGLQAAEAFLSVGREQFQRVQASLPSDSPAAILRKLFERLGATYIKLGQFIASSPTLFPAEYVTEFQKCLDQTPSVSFDVIRQIVETELGMSLEDVFESVDPVPLASASIAQVHAAVLRGSRREVVIKVLKPGVEDSLITDLNFLYLASRALEVASPGLSRTSLSAIIGDVRASMLQEVDFTQEARHVEHFASFLDATGLRSLATCPQLYRQYCTRRVMVMERLRGAALTDLDAVRRTAGGDPEIILVNALNVWIGSVMGAETFHADVHAGNLLVLSDGRVGFIDFGIVGKISQPTWRAVEALLRATVAADYETMAKALVTIGAADGEVNMDAFASDLKDLASSLQTMDADLIVASRNGEVSASFATDDEAVNRFLIDLVRVGEDNGVRFPREFALLIKQILYFDRYTRLLAPTLRVFDDERIDMAGRNVGGGDLWDLSPSDFKAV